MKRFLLVCVSVLALLVLSGFGSVQMMSGCSPAGMPLGAGAFDCSH